LQLGTLGLSGAFYPVWVAMQQGMFRDQGLVVEWNAVQTQEAITGLISGSLDASLAGTDTGVVAVSKGASVRLVSDFQVEAPYDLMARSEIASVDGLRGKKIGVANLRGGSGTAVRLMLRPYGLTDQDYELTATGGNPQRFVALQSGGVDASLLGDPVSFLARQEGYRPLLTFADVVPDFLFTSTWVTNDWLASADNREALVGFLAALIRAKQWALAPENREVLLALWMERTQSPRNVVELMYDDYIVKRPAQVDFSDVREAPLRMVVQAMRELEDLPPMPPEAQWVDRGYAERARGLAGAPR
jgi:ABC-type nitrate/sulfonate/bicarbonate transport system substrate-binding protein